MSSTICDPPLATIDWRGLTLSSSGDPALSLQSQVEGLGMLTPAQELIQLPTGVAPGPLILPQRDVTVSAVVTVTAVSRNALRSVMVPGPTTTTYELVFTEWDHDAPRMLYAEARTMATSIDRSMFRTGGYLFDLGWIARDPRIYNTVETEVEIDDTNPLVTNQGTWSAPWKVIVEGPCTGPRVRNWDNASEVMRFDDVILANGDTLTIDTRVRTAILASGAFEFDVWAWARDDDGRIATPFPIKAGGGNVGFASATGADTATMIVRDCWL